MREPNGRKVPIGNGNSKSLVEEIDAAVVEVESIKTALKCGEGKMEMSYLGLVGGSDRRSLLQLLQSGMQQLDRLREKEIELLKSRSNDLADTNAGDNCLARQCCRQPTDWSGGRVLVFELRRVLDVFPPNQFNHRLSAIVSASPAARSHHRCSQSEEEPWRLCDYGCC